jgi:hypothetical protein
LNTLFIKTDQSALGSQGLLWSSRICSIR